MTQEQFDNYQFSINTEVLHRGEWVGITEVDFKERWLGLKSEETINSLYEMICK